jgi:hypothetical protein
VPDQICIKVWAGDMSSNIFEDLQVFNDHGKYGCYRSIEELIISLHNRGKAVTGHLLNLERTRAAPSALLPF